jgi:hypothetical protein
MQVVALASGMLAWLGRVEEGLSEQAVARQREL